jgi:hypothetical protein
MKHFPDLAVGSSSNEFQQTVRADVVTIGGHWQGGSFGGE